MSNLRVPKRRVPAEVLLASGESRRISLFLAEAGAGHAGPERPSDLLRAPEDFLPAVDEESGLITFLNRAALALVRVDRALEPDGADGITLPAEHEVEVLLRTGARLRGFLSYLPALPHHRVLDFLNERSPFLRLLEEGTVALVSKRHVAQVVLLT